MFDRRPHLQQACCALALPAGACLAQTTFAPDQYYDNRWYITPFGSYIHPDGDRNADNGWGGGVSIGKPINPSWNIELRAQYEELDGNVGTAFGAFNSTNKYKNWSGALDAQWFFLGRQGIDNWQTNSCAAVSRGRHRRHRQQGGEGVQRQRQPHEFHGQRRASASSGRSPPGAAWWPTHAIAMSTTPTTPGSPAGSEH